MNIQGLCPAPRLMPRSAGASADAGLLLTSNLAGAIVDKANYNGDDRYGRAKPDWVRALNGIYAGMVGHQGAQGENPRLAVNIETLISAVRLLKDRDSHEVAPFVASWAPALSTFGSASVSDSHGAAIIKAIEQAIGGRSGFSDREVTKAVASIARAELRPDLSRPFEDAEHFILETLVELLSDHKDVSYFDPLLELARAQPGGLDVITLNYDLTIESAAALGQVRVNRGVDDWVPGNDLSFPPIDGCLNLLKLHGSLDWQVRRSVSQREKLLSPRNVFVELPDLERMRQSGRHSELPWIVVGDREKLATDGPTLALNFAARAALQRANHLAVIGYSFGDGHINAIIRDWIAADTNRTISILDKEWPRRRNYTNITDFRTALIEGYARAQGWQGQSVTPRVLLVEGTAAEKISDVLHKRPQVLTPSLIKVAVTRSEVATQFEITWHGPDLERGSVDVEMDVDGRNNFSTPDRPQLKMVRSPSEESEEKGWTSRVNIPTFRRWPSGTSKTVLGEPNMELPVTLRIEGWSLAGPLTWVVKGELSETTTID
jgi:hypothetical protein